MGITSPNHLRVVGLVFFLLAAAIAPGCPGTEGGADDRIAVIEDPLAGDRVLPFPSDFYTVEDPDNVTGLAVTLVSAPAGDPALGYPGLPEALACLDGFGTYAPVVFAFTGDVDTALLPADGGSSTEPESPAMIVDTDPDSPEQGRPVPFQWTYEPDGHLLSLQPLRPLKKAQRYAALVTTALRTADGEPIRPSPVLDEFLSGKREDERLQGLDERLQADLSVLEQHSVIHGPDDLLALAVFTTQDFAALPIAVASAIRERAVADPVQPVAGSLTVLPGEHPAVAARVEGRFAAGDYRSPSGAVCYPRAEIETGVEPRQWVELEFSLWLPAGSTGPFPVALFLHGMSGSREDGRTAAVILGEIGVAVAAIDAPEHGSRDDGGIEALEFLGLDTRQITIDVRRLQGNFSQTTYDLLQFLMLVLNRFNDLDVLPSGSPDGVADIDPARVFYLGSSLGGVAGPMFLALAPEVSAAVLIVPGGGFSHVFQDGPIFEIFGPDLVPEGGTLADLRRFIAMGQAAVDGADPVNFAPALVADLLEELPRTTPLHLLLQEVMDDSTIPNRSTEALTRALSIPVLPPVLRQIDAVPEGPALPCSGNLDGTTAGLFQFDTVLEGNELVTATHSNLAFNPIGVEQWRRFLETALTGIPEIIDPYVALGLR